MLPWPSLVKLKRFAIMMAIGMEGISDYYNFVLQRIIFRLPSGLELVDITLYPFETSRRELLLSLQLISWRTVFALVAAKKIKHIRIRIHFHGETTSWTDRLKTVLTSEAQHFDCMLYHVANIDSMLTHLDSHFNHFSQALCISYRRRQLAWQVFHIVTNSQGFFLNCYLFMSCTFYILQSYSLSLV